MADQLDDPRFMSPDDRTRRTKLLVSTKSSVGRMTKHPAEGHVPPGAREENERCVSDHAVSHTVSDCAERLLRLAVASARRSKNV
jgi:hypothetical protein